MTTPEGANPARPRPGMFGPVIVSRQAYLVRTGVGAIRFSDLATTKEKPLEECGIPPVLERLLEVTCDDRSNPFDGDGRAAHASRAGSFGPGGRCKSIIDRSDVKCPEATYEVYADSYVRPPGRT